MQFNLPTTKEQMYTILNDLFYYYRIRREAYQDIELQQLDLQRLVIEELSDEQLLEKAEKLVKASHEREIKSYKNDINSQIVKIEEKISLIEQNALQEIASINELYSQSIDKIENQATNAGLVNSSIVVDKTASLLDNKNLKIAQVNQIKNEQIASLTADKQALLTNLDNCDEYFESIHQAEIEIKHLELINDREQLRINTFKYNNGLDEKEQRYANTIKETKASLELRFLDISSGEFTKDQLIDMGYYTDVLRCASGYYDTLESGDAYSDMLNEKKLMIYLEDFYQDFLYVYKLRASS